MALLPTDPRKQKLLMVAVVAIGAAAAYQQLVWSPKAADLHQLATRLDTLDSLNRLSKVEVAKGNAAAMQAEATAFQGQLAVLRGLVPTQNEVPALLDMISTAARHAGLELSDVAPDGVVNGDQFDTYKYKIGVSGPYHKIGEFLANIGSLPRIIAPINLALAISTRPAGDIKLHANEQLLDAKFDIQTYVAHAPPTPAQAGAAKAGAAKPGAH